MDNTNYWTRLHRKSLKRRAFLGSAGAAGIGAAGLALVGCGDDDDSSAPKATGTVSTGAPVGGSTAAASASAAATQAPVKGGTLTWWNPISDPPTFDANTVTSVSIRIPAGHVYSRLLGHKAGPGVNFQAPEIETDLAASYEVLDQGQTISFKLRPGVKFQAPVSRDLKASDVVFSFQRYIGALPGSKAGQNAARFKENVESVTAPDDLTVVVKAKRPYFPLVDAFASGSYLFVYPEEAGKGLYDPATKMVGTGPFIMDSFRPGSGMTFVPNKEWFRAKERPVNFDKVDYPFLAGDQLMTQFLGKKIDAYSRVPGADLVNIKKQVPDVQYWGSPTGASSLAFSAKDARFKDPRVRQALAMCLDRDAIDDALFGIKALRSAGINTEMGWMNFVSPRNKTEYLDPKGTEIKPDVARLFKKDIAEAKKLLSAAGFSGDVKISWPSLYGEPYKTEVEIIAQMFIEAGVKATVDTQDYASVYVPKTITGDFENIALMSDGQSDPADYIELWFLSSSARNAGKVNDPEVDKRIADIQATFNNQQRAQKLKDIQAYLDEKMYNLPIESSGGLVWAVAHSHLKNVKDYPSTPSPYSYGWPSEGLPFWWKSA